MDTLDPRYRLGIEVMDREHAQLIHLVEELQLSLDDRGVVRRPLAPIVARLMLHAPVHFDNEEKLMSRADYPGLPAHRARHQDLANQLRRLAADLLKDEMAAAKNIHTLMESWLFDHLLTEDQAFAQFESAR